MSVRPVAIADTFCTIMSMLTPASATIPKIPAAAPTLSGTPTTVILPSLRSCATPEIMACSIPASSDSSPACPLTQVPILSLNEDRTWIGRLYRRAYSTHRGISTFAPHAAISSISSYVIRGIRRAPRTSRGSSVNTPSTSV